MCCHRGESASEHDRLEAAGGHLRIVAKPGPVYNLLEIAGVVQILDVTDSLHPPALGGDPDVELAPPVVE